MGGFKGFYTRHQGFFNKFSGLILSNTVLERGLVIAPVVITGNSLKNAAGLALAFFIITFFTICLTYFVPRKIPNAFRAIINTMTASCLFIPASMLINFLMPGLVSSVGVFLPLLVTNSLIVQKSASRFHAKPFPAMAVDLFNHAAGFGIVICVVGLVREILGNASIWGVSLNSFPKVPAVLLPFSGFIIVGIMAAAVQKFKLYLTGEWSHQEEAGSVE